MSFPVGGDDDGFVYSFVDAGLEQERDIVDNDGFRILMGGLSSKTFLLAGHTRMDDTLQHPAFGWMAEYDGAECMTVDRTVRIQYPLAECVDNIPPGWFAGLDYLTRQFIGVDYHSSPGLEQPCHGAFASSDSSCQSYQNHRGGAYHAPCPLETLIDRSGSRLV